MGSLLESLPKKRLFPSMPRWGDDLPIFQSHGLPIKEAHLIGLRKRISSFSVKIQPLSTASADWAFRRSKSMPSLGDFAGGSLRRWWGWVVSRKPAFAQDIEMNEEEAAMLGGYHARGTWRHIFHKVRAKIWKLTGSHTVHYQPGVQVRLSQLRPKLGPWQVTRSAMVKILFD